MGKGKQYSSLQDTQRLYDDKLIVELKHAWGYPDPDSKDTNLEVIGELEITENRKTNKPLYFLRNLRSFVDLHRIEYPGETRDKSIFIPPRFIPTRFINGNANLSSQLLKARVRLSSKEERDKQNNPYSLVVDGYVEKLTEIPEEHFQPNSDGEQYYLENVIVDFYKKKNSFSIEKQKSLDMDRVDADFQRNKDLQKSELARQKEQIDTGRKQLINLNKDAESKKEHAATLTSDIQDKSNKKELLQTEIIKLYKRKIKMESKLNRLTEFVGDKAETLCKLGLLSEKHKKLFQSQGHDDKNQINQERIDFHKDLNGNFIDALQYIQMYLYKKDIYYKQDLLNDFFALLRTNDLIILAGDSGSGKTHLVRSMAEAIGGKSVIIPVKPNWTGAEDLLGYYNPLEKKYLKTPFLTALIEAGQNPDTPYLICLDEMNLARVEYYFADFLSILEERDKEPEIPLYSDSEESHTLSEVKIFLQLIDKIRADQGKEKLERFVDILKDEELNKKLHQICGFDGGSLLSYRAQLSRAISSFIDTPSSIKMPGNVRIIGTINVDETTHYLSPKILDRAHIIHFTSPLLNDWDEFEKELREFEISHAPIRFDIKDLGVRASYPKFEKDETLAELIVNITNKYLDQLGVEIGFRTVRQALNYYKELGVFESFEVVLNNFILHKVLPKLMFDGEKSINGKPKKDVLQEFRHSLNELFASDSMECIVALDRVIENAKANDWVVNYWSK